MLMMYRHGLRVSEAVRLRREDVNLDQARLWVERAKNGLSVEHPIPGDELRAIKRYLSGRTDRLPWLFISERGTQLTERAVSPRRTAGERSARRASTRAQLRLLSPMGHRPPRDADYWGIAIRGLRVHYTRVVGRPSGGCRWRPVAVAAGPRPAGGRRTAGGVGPSPRPVGWRPRRVTEGGVKGPGALCSMSQIVAGEGLRPPKSADFPW
jgi:hypothetical protein